MGPKRMGPGIEGIFLPQSMVLYLTKKKNPQLARKYKHSVMSNLHNGHYLTL